MRRVVMGTDVEGKSVVLADEPVSPTELTLVPGMKIYQVWNLEGTPTLPVTEPNEKPSGSYFPPPGGLRFGAVSVPPAGSHTLPAGTDLEAAAAEAEAKVPGLLAAMDLERPGMHTSNTVDYILVLSGQVRMRTDDDVDVHLSAGDCVIQNGTAHAWFNDTDEPAVLGFAMCGANIEGQ